MSITSPTADPEIDAQGTPTSRRERPLITEEVDRPLDDKSDICGGGHHGDSPTVKTIEAKEQEHKHKVEDDKKVIGGILRAVCFGIIAVSYTHLDVYKRQPSGRLSAGILASAAKGI